MLYRHSFPKQTRAGQWLGARKERRAQWEGLSFLLAAATHQCVPCPYCQPDVPPPLHPLQAMAELLEYRSTDDEAQVKFQGCGGNLSTLRLWADLVGKCFCDIAGLDCMACQIRSTLIPGIALVGFTQISVVLAVTTQTSKC